MKKFLHILFILCCFLSVSLATTFERTDSTLTQATQIMSGTAEKKISWEEEKSRLLSLVSSYEAILKSKRSALKKLQNENSKIEENVKVISEKIAKDESAIADISKCLDSYFAKLMQNKSAIKILKENSFQLDEFKSKSIVEKLSFLSRAYAKLLEADMSINKDGTNISTGIFTVASGKAEGDIVVLKLKGERK